MKTINISIIMWKKLLLIVLLVNVFSTLNAQSYHYYWSPQTNYYIQIGFFGKTIQYRLPDNSKPTPFVTLNFMGNQNGMSYYGNNQFQVAINKNSSQVCVISKQGSIWYKYVAPVSIPNPYGGSTQPSYNNNNTGSQSKSRCAWCNGTGRITKNDHVTQYTSNDYTVTERCRECGYEYISTYTHHYHLDCGHCGGTGYYR